MNPHGDAADKGAAAVEMAFTIVLLLWLVLGIIDMGRAIYTNIALEEAAQAGVAYAAFTEGANPGSVAATVVSSTDSIPLTSGDVQVACVGVPRTGPDAGRVQVTVEYQMDYITPLVGDALGGFLELSRTAEAERFYECGAL